MRGPAWTHCPLARAQGAKTMDLFTLQPYPTSFTPTGTPRMRTGILAAFTGMLALGHVAHSLAFDDADFCAAMEEIAKMRATYARVAVAVACDAKIVNFRIRLDATVNGPSSGWQERTHTLMNQMYCQGPMRAAIDHGWTIAFTIVSARESYYMTAECR